MAAARRGTVSPAQLAVPEPVLEQLEAHGIGLTTILEDVEERLGEQVSSSHAFVDRAARYLLDAGGKRFRPLLVGLTAHLGDPTGDEIPDAGVVVELVHLATLYHDDVIDEATARRGTPSANLRWDNTVAILTGDYLFARASELSADLGVEVTRIMARTIATLCEGQIREVQGSAGALPPDVPGLEPTLDHYLAVVEQKTASLIATSCRLGALLAGCPDEHVAAAARYGRSVGMAFQLSDDILDIASDAEQSGKTPGTDIREGVRTLPIVYGVEDDPDGELTDLIQRGPDLEDRELERALDLLRGGAALSRARDAAAEHVGAATAELEPFGDGPAVKALRRLAAYALDRAE